VNPPLGRMAAALPVLAIGCETDWSRFYEGPGSRAEFPLGENFIKANGQASIPLFFYARWACITFNLIGAYFAYRWAKELYNCTAAGFVTLILYVFEPNLLAHGELITPDGACTAFGILAGYTFWRWLKQPTWMSAIIAGLALGVAELTKMSWLILFGLWPLLWLVWRCSGSVGSAEALRGEPNNVESIESRVDSQRDAISGEWNAQSAKPTGCAPSVPQLATILVLKSPA
jgi:dolichyl-phosphate-mannose--protein O-mannosyl transferase